MSKRWHITKEGEGIALSRHLPVRFDFAVRTDLPPVAPVRLAHQIRQDLWRALQSVRGFSPAVRLEPTSTGWAVTAGGRISGRVAPSIVERAAAVLEDADNRTRWVRCAGGLP